jgi:hypothetical protein
LVDYHIQMVRDAKAEVIDEFVEKLRREDHEELEIPLIIPYGYLNHRRLRCGQVDDELIASFA